LFFESETSERKMGQMRDAGEERHLTDGRVEDNVSEGCMVKWERRVLDWNAVYLLSSE
jgi:hypothetical protein